MRKKKNYTKRFAKAVITTVLVSVLSLSATGNLDSNSGREIMDLFKKLNKEKGITILQVTHSEAFASYSTRSVRIENGHVA